MKITSFLVGHLPTVLSDGFFTEGIGEQRMMQDVAKSLLDAGYDVIIPGKFEWLSDEEKPKNLIETGYVGDDFPFVYIDWWPGNPIFSKKAVLTILYGFDCNGDTSMCKQPTVAVFAYADGSSIRYTAWKKHMADKFYFLPSCPPIEYSKECPSNFYKNNIFWTTKSGLFSVGQNDSALVKKLLLWVSDKLRENSDITFSMISYGHVFDEEKTTSAVEGNVLYKKLIKPYSDRVNLLGRITFREFIKELRKSKIVINRGIYDHTFCGAPIQAALCGIPNIQYNEGPFSQMLGSLKVQNSSKAAEYVSLLDKLYYDKDFYDNNAKKYFEYASFVYSQENFLNILEGIVNRFC